MIVITRHKDTSNENIDVEHVKKLLNELIKALNLSAEEIEYLNNSMQNQTDIISMAQGIIAGDYIMTNNRAARSITSRDVEFINNPEKKGAVTVLPFGKNKPDVETKYCLIYAEDKTLHRLTEYQRAIFNAVCSLWAEAARSKKECVITVKDIYRALTGQTKANEKAEKEIIDAMHLFANMKYSHEITEELEKRKITDFSYAKIDDVPFVPMMRVRVRMKNAQSEKIGYQLLAAPPLMRACQLSPSNNKGCQMLTVNHKLIEIPSLQATEKNIVLRDYLIRYIDYMKTEFKGKRGKSFTIYFDKVFEDVYGKTESDRTENKRLRETMELMLSHWSGCGFIDTFKAAKSGQKIIGFKVFF